MNNYSSDDDADSNLAESAQKIPQYAFEQFEKYNGYPSIHHIITVNDDKMKFNCETDIDDMIRALLHKLNEILLILGRQLLRAKEKTFLYIVVPEISPLGRLHAHAMCFSPALANPYWISKIKKLFNKIGYNKMFNCDDPYKYLCYIFKDFYKLPYHVRRYILLNNDTIGISQALAGRLAKAYPVGDAALTIP